MGDDRGYALIALGLAGVFGLQVFFGGLEEALTWDESGYIASGYVHWTEGDHRLAPDHPPLMQKLQALPLLLLDIEAPPLAELAWGRDPNPRASYGQRFFFFSGNDPVQMARLARAPVGLLGMLLVFCVYGFGRELMKPESALLACALAAFDPNLIAHAKLATEDLGCSALMLAAVWTLWRWLELPGMGRAALCGVATALALLSKYAALLLFPIDLALMGLWWSMRRPEISWPMRSREMGVMAAIGLVLINFSYGLGFHLDEYVSGVAQIYPDIADDYVFYFWGSVQDEPFWYYAIVSLAIKTPLSVWLLLGLACVGIWRSPDTRQRACVLLIPMFVVLGVSCFDTTAPGVRRILPAVPMMLLLAGLALEAGATIANRWLAWGALAGSVVAAVLIFPHHLSYLNPLFGGPERGPYILDESNIDWGQDLPALARWQAENAPDETIALMYFGTSDPASYGVRWVPFDLASIESPLPGITAISAHQLVYFRKLQARAGTDSDWLALYRPIAKAGYSIFIYRFPESRRQR